MTQFEAERADVLDRFARALLLNTRWAVHALVAEDPDELRDAFMHAFAQQLSGSGVMFELRYFEFAAADEARATIERLIEARPTQRQLIICNFAHGENPGVADFFASLNGRRDTMGRTLRGDLVVWLPSRLERSVSAAPDLASTMRTWYLPRVAPDLTLVRRWLEQCDGRFDELTRSDEARERFQHGTYTFAYAFEAGAVTLAPSELLEKMQGVPGFTGWSPWWVPANKFPPRVHADLLECWMFGPEQLFPNPAHSDFWRASIQGQLYLRRGYDEDSSEHIPPGQVWSNDLAIWRTGEALLHVEGLARALDLRPHVRVGFIARWSGLAGRRMSQWPDYPREDDDGDSARADQVTSELAFELDELDGDGLDHLVLRLVTSLYAAFEGHAITQAFVTEQLRRLLKGRTR